MPQEFSTHVLFGRLTLAQWYRQPHHILQMLMAPFRILGHVISDRSLNPTRLQGVPEPERLRPLAT